MPGTDNGRKVAILILPAISVDIGVEKLIEVKKLTS
jgi:hypothetical protein